MRPDLVYLQQKLDKNSPRQRSSLPVIENTVVSEDNLIVGANGGSFGVNGGDSGTPESFSLDPIPFAAINCDFVLGSCRELSVDTAVDTSAEGCAGATTLAFSGSAGGEG